MTKFKVFFKKAWVLVAAAALIAGSNSIMAFALNRNVPTDVSTKAASITAPAAENTQNQIGKAAAAAEYTVIDLSKTQPALKDRIKEKLSMIPDITPEQIEEKYNEIIANLTPADKDISAEQAAAYTADILEKAYRVDLEGYTAEAGFSRNPVPDYDNWTVTFRSPEAAQNNEQRWVGKMYYASVNSVDGTMLNAGAYDSDYTPQISKDLKDPAWVEKAEQAISVLLPEKVSINSSRVVATHPEAGVTVVCELSDGSACAVRLLGENKEAAAYVFFPHGYDGSLDPKPLTENSVG